MIFERGAVAALRIAPIVLGNKLFEAAISGERGAAVWMSVKAKPLALNLPAVFDGTPRFGEMDRVTKRQRRVIFCV